MGETFVVMGPATQIALVRLLFQTSTTHDNPYAPSE